MKKYNIFSGLVERLEKRAASQNERVAKYEFWGLALFVAIPLPGTGGWTGSLIASVMKMNKKRAFLSALTGVIAAGIAVTIITYGLVGFFVR